MKKITLEINDIAYWFPNCKIGYNSYWDVRN